MAEAAITIENEGIIYSPALIEPIKLYWAREGEPGRLTFTALKDEELNFQEGSTVRLAVDGRKLFFGYVFTKKRTSNQQISVTAYDQMRFLKNHDSIKYSDTASGIIKTIAEGCRLSCGELAQTKVSISRREDNTTYFEIIKNALDITAAYGEGVYVLYDDYGRLTLKSPKDMISSTLICAEGAGDFVYETSIEAGVYNRIKLYRDDHSLGERIVHVESDGKSIEKWGVLQLYRRAEEDTELSDAAKAMLKLYGSKKRRLTVKNALGDTEVRGGTLIPVSLALGDINANSYLMTEAVTHTFKNGVHTMDLELGGGDFV